jgi:uncharacterized protein YjbI with pentapeptide repeats
MRPLDLLHKGQKTEWTSWREQVSGNLPSLPGAHLQKASLRGWPLAGIKLPDANLRNADLRDADLTDADLTGADLTRANLAWATLSGARLTGAKLNDAFLNGAFLSETDFTDAKLERAELPEAQFYATVFHGALLNYANLSGVRLQKVDFTGATLCHTNLTNTEFITTKLCRANLHRSNLERTRFIDVDIQGAIIREARVYGIAVWDLRNAQSAVQHDLLVTPAGEREVRVDDLEMAQFVYMLLRNEKIRNVIDVMTTKAVLIIGRFTPRRKNVLDSIKEALRDEGYLPILFDFIGSPRRKVRETIQILAGLACFVIADLTSAKGVISELELIVKAFPSLPVQPVLHASSTIGFLLEELREDHPWLQPEFSYQSGADLLLNLKEQVIRPAKTWMPQKNRLADALAMIARLERQVAELTRQK